MRDEVGEGMVQRREMDGEGRSAGADQSRREPWKGKRGKSGASKETGTSSVRGHCKTEAERERALQGVSNLEKMAWQTTTGPSKSSAYVERNCRNGERGKRLSTVFIPSASSYFTVKPGGHRKEMKKYNSHLLQLTGT